MQTLTEIIDFDRMCPDGARLAARIEQSGGQVISITCSSTVRAILRGWADRRDAHSHRVTAQFPADVASHA